MLIPKERSRDSKSACRNDPEGLSLQEVTEQGGCRNLGFQRTLRSWSARPGCSPLVELKAYSLPQLFFKSLLLLKSFQTDIHPDPSPSHPPSPLTTVLSPYTHTHCALPPHTHTVPCPHTHTLCPAPATHTLCFGSLWGLPWHDPEKLKCLFASRLQAGSATRHAPGGALCSIPLSTRSVNVA